LVAEPWRSYHHDIDAVKDGRLGADHRIMRPGKAEDAVRAIGKVRLVGRRLWRAGYIVQAQFDGRSVLTGNRRQGDAGYSD
jgi:hypothetical protein